MIKKVSINSFIKKYEIIDIEKQLVCQYLKTNHISYQDNSFILNYLDGFCASPQLIKDIEDLNHITLEEISIDMELLIPAIDKKINGAFFTPSYIVDYIINTIHPSENAKIIDPSCGSGAFLLGIIRYYIQQYGKSVSQCIKENIYGSDILAYNILRSKLLLVLCGLTYKESIDINDIHIIQCDSLRQNWTQKFDVVIGNPPYVKFQDMEDSTRNFLLKEWETTKYGTFNLYFAFFELGLKLLKKEGVMGYITPNNYFTSLAGECLRDFFQSKRCIYQIVDFGSTKVFDVQTYTAITFLNKEKNNFIAYNRINENEDPISFLTQMTFTQNEYAHLTNKKWRLLCGSERENIHKLEHSGTPLGDMFDICVGIATLKDEIYFIDPLSENEQYYTIIKADKEYKIEKEITRQLIKISDIKTQSDIKKNRRRIIFPYTISKNKASVIDENIIKEQYPKCYEYLLSVKNILSLRGKGKHQYSPFYSYGRTQGLSRRGIKLLTPTFSKYPRFLIDNADNSFFTNGYGIYYKETNQNILFPNPIASQENIDALQKILNSSLMDYYVRKTSVSIDGGYPCYQKNFIERFTIPDFSESEIANLKNLTDPKEINNFLSHKYQINLPSPNLEE